MRYGDYLGQVRRSWLNSTEFTSMRVLPGFGFVDAPLGGGAAQALGDLHGAEARASHGTENGAAGHHVPQKVRNSAMKAPDAGSA